MWLATHADDLKELDQLERLGENMKKRMMHLHNDQHGRAFPGIDGLIEDGDIAIPISLKEVSSNKLSALNRNIRAIAERANNANNMPEFNSVIKEVTGMVTARRFTKQQIIDEIRSARLINPQESAIVTRYFVEGKDGSGWITF